MMTAIVVPVALDHPPAINSSHLPEPIQTDTGGATLVTPRSDHPGTDAGAVARRHWTRADSCTSSTGNMVTCTTGRPR